MALIIEVLSKQHKVLERHRFSEPRIRLGRAFNNDLILYDKHISPHHAELVQDEQGNWQLQDLASLNGSFTRPDVRVAQQAEVQSGQLCWLGEQALRLYDEHHPVPPAQPFNRVEQQLRLFGHPALLVLLALLLLGEELFGFWLNVPSEGQQQWSRSLVNMPLMLMGLALWPALLAIWARINQHEARFLPQLGITFFVLVLMALWQGLMSVVNFSLDGATAVVWLGEFGQFALISALLTANFYLALQISALKRMLLATALALVISLQGVAVNLLLDEQRSLQPAFDNSLLPLTFYLNKPTSLAEFNAESEALFRQTTEARAEKTSD